VGPDDLPSPRVAFVGQRSFFAAHALSGSAGGVEGTFVDVRVGGDATDANAELRQLDPDVVVALRPDAIPPGTLDGLRARVLGVVTEPLPGANRPDHPNLTYNLAELERADAGALDRVIVTDPDSADAAARVLGPVWRTMPLPVDDALYAAPRATRRPPRIIFIGYSTMHREETLIGLKHEFDLPHYAYGLTGDDLREVLHEADAGLLVPAEAELPVFEDTMLLHLAAGHLVVAQQPPPGNTYGLKPGRDYLQVADRDELRLRVAQLHDAPDAYDRIRVQGHQASLPFAASRVWPRVVADLLSR
jgi:hypothetical protein